MSISQLTIAMAMAVAPANINSPPTGLTLQSSLSIINDQDTLAPVSLEELTLSLPSRSLHSSPPHAISTSAPATALSMESAFTAQQTPDVTGNETILPADPASPSPPPADEQSEYSTIIVTARPRAPKIDPLQELNVESFEVIQSVDRAIVGPVALEYKETVPGPVRDGLRNFISNLGEPVVFLNYLLQLKPGKAMETLGRFTINTTIGVGGLFDIAKRPPINLPNRSNGFANTLGYYGVKPGAFLFLPLVGPTTVRDAIGGSLDLFALPFAVGKPFNQLVFTLPGGVISSLDSRAEYNEQLTKLREESDDPYTAVRTFYLQKRKAEIDVLRGRIPDPLNSPSSQSSIIVTLPENGSTPIASPLGIFLTDDSEPEAPESKSPEH